MKWVNYDLGKKTFILTYMLKIFWIISLILSTFFVIGCTIKSKILPKENYISASFFDSLKLRYYDSTSTFDDSSIQYKNGFIPDTITFTRESKVQTLFEACTFKHNGFDSSIRDLALFFDSCKLDSIQFRNSHFHADVDFMESIMTDPFFLNSTYDSSFLMNHGTLNSVDFQENVFKGNVVFYLCKITNHLRFYLDDFTAAKMLDFTSSKLPDTIIFSSVKLGPTVDFGVSDLNDRAADPIYIEFKDCDLTKFKLDYQHFRLLFDSISNDEKEGVYEGLLNNFKNRGQLESFKNLDIEYKRFKLRQNWYTYLFSWLNWAWWNYGYTKALVFLWTTIFLLIFTPITYTNLYYLTKSVYEVPQIPPTFHIKRKRDKWWYSFIYTASIFFKLTLKMENLKFKDKWWTAYIVLVYVLGIVCLAYMANFVLQK